MNSFKQYITEIKQSSTEEYIQAVSNFYDDEITSLILSSEHQLGMFIDIDQIQTEKTDDNDLIIRYYEDDEQVLILGMISKSGHINRSQLIELRVWLGRLKDAMKEGKPVISSLNNLSAPIMQRVVDSLEKEGYNINKTEFNKTNIGGNVWITYMFEVNQ